MTVKPRALVLLGGGLARAFARLDDRGQLDVVDRLERLEVRLRDTPAADQDEAVRVAALILSTMATCQLVCVKRRAAARPNPIPAWPR